MLLDTSKIPGSSYHVSIAGERITTLGIPYLSKYPVQFYNVSIRPVDHPLLMYKVFGSVIEVDSYNKYRNSDIALDKFWVTKCGWIRLCTTVAMVMTITNFGKLFHYGVKRYHYDKLLASGNSWNELLLIASRILSKKAHGRWKRTYITLITLITKALCIPIGDSTIPVLLLEIQRSAQYQISQAILLRLLLLTIRI